MFYSIYDNGAKSAMGNFAAYDAIPGVETSSVFFEPVNSLVSGELTVNEWLENIKSVNDQLRENLK
jgi:carbohydrate ABC transporter substrate-binding protein, CUT1 family (TC 3.A.1.1.-)